MASQHLTKSRYIAGLQCPRRLWLLVHEPPPYEEPAPGSPLDIGQEIGRKAHLLFPGGALVDEEPWRHAEAVARTAALMIDERVPAIFEAAFEYDDIRIRVDVLERLAHGDMGTARGEEQQRSEGSLFRRYCPPGLRSRRGRRCGLFDRAAPCEYRLCARARRHHAGRISSPAWMCATPLPRGLPTCRAAFPPCGIASAWSSFPTPNRGASAEHPTRASSGTDARRTSPPTGSSIFPACRRPARANSRRSASSPSPAIPADFPLTSKQVIIRDATASGQPYVAPDLARLLRCCGPPACYLDFEAMMPPIPLYEGTRPYQTIPFQWSLHAIDADGVLHHREFLAEGGDDPRRRFAETLIEALAAFDGPILVYSAYEQTRLKELAGEFPDLSASLNALIARLVDLLPIVRAAVYFPEFQFSNSIKSVAPALCPGFGYDDLEGVADGGAASAAFLQLASGSLTIPEQVEQLRAALLAYCQRDTLALVEVHRALTRLALPGLAPQQP